VKILLIEDDENMVDYIMNVLNIGWPEAEFIYSYKGRNGVELLTSESPDVVLLDLGLPDISGFEVLKQIRETSTVIPIMIISVRGEEQDIVKGMSMGADEYIVKPFRQLELLARLRALVRRQQTTTDDLTTGYGPLHFGKSLREVIRGEREIKVTLTEGRVLHILIKKRGKVVKTAELAKEIWGNQVDASNNVKTYIYRLRKRLESDPLNPEIILNEPGIGYFISSKS